MSRTQGTASWALIPSSFILCPVVSILSPWFPLVVYAFSPVAASCTQSTLFGSPSRDMYLLLSTLPFLRCFCLPSSIPDVRSALSAPVHSYLSPNLAVGHRRHQSSALCAEIEGKNSGQDGGKKKRTPGGRRRTGEFSAALSCLLRPFLYLMLTAV